MGKIFDNIIRPVASFIARHWLLLANVSVMLFIIPILLYPYFISLDSPFMHTIAGAIKTAYHGTCHQLPERSLFIFGYQMAVCSRCFAIYVSFLIGGIAFWLIRNKLKPWDIKYYVLFCIPMAIDGFTQLFGFRESTNELRILTGGIFGLASALYIFPYLETIFNMEEPDTGALNEKTGPK